MIIRLAKESDLEAILYTINKAREIMLSIGNLTQWPEDYPNINDVKSDIEEQKQFLCIEEDKVVASFSFQKGPDPTYLNIIDGAWLNDSPYYVIHRLASDGSTKGLGKKILDWCFTQCNNIRVDTHEDNAIMLHLFKKLGFSYCGKIIVYNGTERLAFQRII